MPAGSAEERGVRARGGSARRKTSQAQAREQLELELERGRPAPGVVVGSRSLCQGTGTVRAVSSVAVVVGRRSCFVQASSGLSSSTPPVGTRQ